MRGDVHEPEPEVCTRFFSFCDSLFMSYFVAELEDRHQLN